MGWLMESEIQVLVISSSLSFLFSGVAAVCVPPPHRRVRTLESVAPSGVLLAYYVD